jgi:hypothetical protein
MNPEVGDRNVFSRVRPPTSPLPLYYTMNDALPWARSPREAVLRVPHMRARTRTLGLGQEDPAGSVRTGWASRSRGPGSYWRRGWLDGV